MGPGQREGGDGPLTPGGSALAVVPSGGATLPRKQFTNPCRALNPGSRPPGLTCCKSVSETKRNEVCILEEKDLWPRLGADPRESAGEIAQPGNKIPQS